MAEILDNIIDNLNNDRLTTALKLCEQNKDKKIEHIISNIKGVILFKQKNYKLAKTEFVKSINRDKKFIDPYKNLFKLHLKLKNFKSAILNALNVIELETTENSLSFFNLALAYDLDENFEKAIEIYKKIENLEFKEKKILFNNLAKCYLSTENINEAEKYYLKALELDQNDKIVINNLLIFYLRLGNYSKSEKFYNKAKALDLNYLEFRLNESEYFLFKGDIEKAIKILNSIIFETKNYFAYKKLAKIYSMINDNKKAFEIIEEALTIYPNKKDLKVNKGIIYLTEGDFDKGWEFYEYRKSIVNDESFENIKIWKGENLTDSNLLVTCEQGMGDVLQFSKFLMNLSPLCKKIDFCLYDKLIPIYKKKINNINICKKSEIVKNNYDYRISLGSLNKFFYKENNFQSSELLDFRNDPKEKYSSILDNKKRNIGLIWSGNFFGPKEPFRSIELKNFYKLLKLNANYYSFQNEIWDRDKEFFKKSNIVDYSKKKFSEIIGIIQNLDLVISTDTFFLHLSCICNKETWGLIPFNADWRWYDYYKFNPYKTLKIYKQNNYNNWDAVIQLIEEDLKIKFDI